MVELLKCYSTNSELQRRVSSYLEKQRRIVCTYRSPAEPELLRERKSNRRLTEPEVQEMTDLYRAGVSVYDLGVHFGIHRATVSILLERADVPRRYRILDSENIAEAAEFYGTGWSLKRVGTHFGVNAQTVRNAFVQHSDQHVDGLGGQAPGHGC